MGALGFSRNTLAAMRLSQLRELARHLGVPRYSSMLRDQLMTAILVRASRGDIESFGTIPLPGPVAEIPVAEIQVSEIPVAEIPVAASPTLEILPTLQGPASPAKLVASVPESKPLVDGPVSASRTDESSPDPRSLETAALPTVSSVKLGPAEAPLPSPLHVSGNSSTWVSFIPQDPQWAYLSWGISAADRQSAMAAGGQELVIRLTDVTDRFTREARPHSLQEVVVDASATEWHLPIPLGDRDYVVELGYRTSSGTWYSLVFSSATRMPADADLPILPTSFTVESFADAGMNWLFPQPASGLHERLYQQASANRPRMSVGSEEFQAQGALLTEMEGAAGQSSGVGLWASGREASGAGMTARQRNFWLLADAELIVYGATDPSATLTVANQSMPLATDGSFRLHMAFPDGEQSYPIRAIACDGEQNRSITLDFSRTTPHAQVNRKDDAVLEWF